MHSISQLLEDAAHKFVSAGIDTPLLDAQLLMAKALVVSRLDVIAHPEQVLMDDEHASFLTMVNKRAERYPLAYILGRKEFHGLDLIITPSVLVPRPETEILVEETIKRIPLPDAVIADIGTGSGAIAIALAVALPRAKIYAIEISEASLEVARANVEKHQLAGRIELLLGNLTQPLVNIGIAPLTPALSRPHGGEGIGVFDAIVSNPPYIPTDMIKSLQPEVGYEPIEALDGGIDGLNAYRRLIPAALPLLKDDGFLAVEIGAGQSNDVGNIAAGCGSLRVEVVRDLAQIERVVIAARA